MRDRLIELIEKWYEKPTTKYLADYLLENGVVVLPCKVGDKVYVIKRCRCGKPANYQLQQCHKKCIPSTPKVLARIMQQEMGRRLKPDSFCKIEYEDVPKGTICYSVYEKQFTLDMLSKWGKTVFPTKEEAVQALKEGVLNNV